MSDPKPFPSTHAPIPTTTPAPVLKPEAAWPSFVKTGGGVGQKDWAPARETVQAVRRRLTGGVTPAVAEELQAELDTVLRQLAP